jgi:heme/copper-type cytochrome/quinol oxidase subunit 1
MFRPQDLFAVGALILLVLGLLAPSLLPNLNVAVQWHGAGYLFPLRSACVVVATFFCIFSAAYSLWVIHVSERLAMWHFWLTTVGVLVFFLSFWCLARTVPTRSLNSSHLNSVVAVWGQITSIPILLTAQALFLLNFIVALAKFHDGRQ